MAADGWEVPKSWPKGGLAIAPTIVGGSKKHGGADLGPTRSKRAWSRMNVNGVGLANDVPEPGFIGSPKLTIEQAALLQGFPESWEFQGLKTSSYRQVGNAFPPPVAKAVGCAVASAFRATDEGASENTDLRPPRQPRDAAASPSSGSRLSAYCSHRTRSRHRQLGQHSRHPIVDAAATVVRHAPRGSGPPGVACPGSSLPPPPSCRLRDEATGRHRVQT